MNIETNFGRLHGLPFRHLCLVNLMAHDCVIWGRGSNASMDSVSRVYPCGVEARCAKVAQEPVILDDEQWFDVQGPSVLGDVIDLPDPVPGVLFIVSMAVRMKSGRDDLVSPGPSVVVDGLTVGCRGLVANDPSKFRKPQG